MYVYIDVCIYMYVDMLCILIISVFAGCLWCVCVCVLSFLWRGGGIFGCKVVLVVRGLRVLGFVAVTFGFWTHFVELLLMLTLREPESSL